MTKCLKTVSMLISIVTGIAFLFLIWYVVKVTCFNELAVTSRQYAKYRRLLVKIEVLENRTYTEEEMKKAPFKKAQKRLEKLRMKRNELKEILSAKKKVSNME